MSKWILVYRIFLWHYPNPTEIGSFATHFNSHGWRWSLGWYYCFIRFPMVTVVVKFGYTLIDCGENYWLVGLVPLVVGVLVLRTLMGVMFVVWGKQSKIWTQFLCFNFSPTSIKASSYSYSSSFPSNVVGPSFVVVIV